MLVVPGLNCLGRSMPHLVSPIEDLEEMRVSFKPLCDSIIDTIRASEDLIFNIFSFLVQFERKLIQERTKVDLNAART